MKYTVSVLQYEPIFLKPEENFAKIRAMLEPIKSDLVVLPELALSGYVFKSIDEVAQIAESISLLSGSWRKSWIAPSATALPKKKRIHSITAVPW
jgi:predicted amidohydrolase